MNSILRLTRIGYLAALTVVVFVLASARHSDAQSIVPLRRNNVITQQSLLSGFGGGIVTVGTGMPGPMAIQPVVNNSSTISFGLQVSGGIGGGSQVFGGVSGFGGGQGGFGGGQIGGFGGGIQGGFGGGQIGGFGGGKGGIGGFSGMRGL
ncbi:MAG TPA: hypothetical protein VFE78_21445 [Gemmataceae bacterium]|nr:hypothetical protein [Gemmataceae bacterium]